MILLNPLAPLFELGRSWIIDPSAPGPVALAGNGLKLLAPGGLYVGICVFAVWFFRREAPRIAERL